MSSAIVGVLIAVIPISGQIVPKIIRKIGMMEEWLNSIDAVSLRYKGRVIRSCILRSCKDAFGAESGVAIEDVDAAILQDQQWAQAGEGE